MLRAAGTTALEKEQRAKSYWKNEARRLRAALKKERRKANVDQKPRGQRIAVQNTSTKPRSKQSAVQKTSTKRTGKQSVQRFPTL